jgi:Spy/CpxP family protein refolding chaperone
LSQRIRYKYFFPTLNFGKKNASNPKNEKDMKAPIVLLFAVLISFAGFSQEDDGDERGTKQADKMKSELNLTDAQYQSIKAINEKYAGKIDAEKEKKAVTKETLKTLKDQRKQEVSKVLTKEQLTKWEAYKEEKKENKKEKKAERKEFREELNLTPEQDTKMKEIHRTYATQKRQVTDDKTLTEEARKAKIKILKEERRTQLKAILTPEQFEKLKDEKEERHEERKHQGGRNRK